MPQKLQSFQHTQPRTACGDLCAAETSGSTGALRKPTPAFLRAIWHSRSETAPVEYIGRSPGEARVALDTM